MHSNESICSVTVTNRTSKNSPESEHIESPGPNQKKRSNDSPLYTIVGYDPAEPPMKLKFRLVKDNVEKPTIYIDRGTHSIQFTDHVPGLPYEYPNETAGGSAIKTEPGEQSQEARLNPTEDFSGDDSKPSTSSADEHSAEVL
ncbi:hypothetical protein RF11_05108 [Thelohanellus kitauei]|uniref:Uncharacterized protein n=1 Tax=Thelohanellus kitauei TaxID=669202 RepID=A0A0C2MQF9_THEKT|nr:hypothetical protein RF11_05108 [Thelohanellus kitauei]